MRDTLRLTMLPFDIMDVSDLSPDERVEVMRLWATPEIGSNATAFVAVRREMSQSAYDQLMALCLSGLDYHAYYSGTHPRVWAQCARLTPEQWQGVYEFAAARPGGVSSFPWDGYAAVRESGR